MKDSFRTFGYTALLATVAFGMFIVGIEITRWM
jgi:hypothetical protein